MASTNNIIVGGAQVFVRNPSDSAVVGSNATLDPTTGRYGKFIRGEVTPDGANTGYWQGLLTSHSVTNSAYDAQRGTDIGFTNDGIDVMFEPEYQDVQVDQLLDAAVIFKTSQKVSFKTSLTEATLENLARAIGQATSTVSGTLVNADDEKVLGLRGGSLGEFPVEVGLVAVANGPRTTIANGKTERVFEAFRAISVESVGIPVKRNEVTAFPVSFRCLPDSLGAYVAVADRVYV
jgi:hypothetical protein